LGGGKTYIKAEMLISEICSFLAERDLRPYFIFISENKEIIEMTLPVFEGKICGVRLLNSIKDYNWETLKKILDNGNK